MHEQIAVALAWSDVSDLAVELELIERAPAPLRDRLPQTIWDVFDRYRHQQRGRHENRMSVEAGTPLQEAT
jgi:hypothetical protein